MPADSAATPGLPLLNEPWFSEREFRERLARVQAGIAERGLAGLVLCQPESITWLTGFWTRGYASLQYALVPRDGEPTIVCRDMEAYYLEHTSVFPTAVYWSDGDDPLAVASDAMERRFGGATLGIELGSWTLSADRYRRLSELAPAIRFENATDLVPSCRRLKSAAEIALMRRAGVAAEAGMAAAAATAGEGISERDLAAEVAAALIRAGSDMPGPGVLSSGERAFHLHGSYIDRRLERGDTVQFEVLACVRHYHARFMRTLKIGHASEAESSMAERLIALQDEALAAVRPGVPATVPDGIYRRGVREAGLGERYTNKTFYGIGLLLPPVSGEGPEAHPGADWSFEPGMTLHSYVLARDFGFSESIVVTDDGCERLTNYDRALIVAGSA